MFRYSKVFKPRLSLSHASGSAAPRSLRTRRLVCEPLEQRQLLAVTWHVDASNVADPLEDGTAAHPFDEIQEGIDQASPGDDILVAPGVYTGDLVVDKADLTLHSSGGKANTTIELSDGVGIDIRGGGGSFCLGGATDEGFTIDDGAGTTFLVQLANGPSDVIISHNTLDMSGNGSQGISVGAAGATGLSIDQNEIVAGDGDGAIFGDSPIVDLRVTDNILTVSGGGQQTSGYGVEFFGLTGTSLIDGNQITGYANGILIANGTGTDGLTISNNTIENGGNGIRFADYVQTGTAGDVGSVSLTGNTLANNGTGMLFGAGAHLAAGTFTITANTFTGNTEYQFRSTGTVFDGTEIFALFSDGNNAFATATVVSDGSNVVQYTTSWNIRPGIQQSIDDASSGYDVVVGSGIYAEGLVVDKSLRIRGSTGTPTDVVINPGASNDGITIVGGNDVAVQGLRITGADHAMLVDNVTNLELANLVLDGNNSGITVVNAGSVRIAGSSGDDEIVIDGTAAARVDVSVNGNQAMSLQGMTSLDVCGEAGDDAFYVQAGAGLAGVTISVAGGDHDSQGDLLQVAGSSDATELVYTPDVASQGSGQVALGGMSTITFTELEPIDVTGFATATITLPGADDVLTVSNSFDAATGLVPALRVAGTSGGVDIEDARFFGNATVVVDTSAVDGNDSVTINSADNAHDNTNLQVITGAGADTIAVIGAVAVTGDLTFSGGAVTQTAAITAAGLELLGAGPFMLTDAGNDVDTLAADTSGEIELVDADDLIIGTVGSTSGITTTGVDVSLTTGATLGIEAPIDLAAGNLTLTSGGAVTQTAAITAAGLELLGAGPFTLTHAGNDVDTLAANTSGEIELVDADDLIVGTVGTTSGITTTGVDVSLTTGATLGIEAAIDLAGGELTLTTGGAVSQTAAITAAGLELLGAGPFTLTHAGNDVDTLAASTTGEIELVDADDLVVGTVGSTSGITTTSVDVGLTTGTTLGIEAPIDLAAGNLTLTSGGAVSQTAAITAAGLELLGAGPFMLTDAGNDVDTLAADTTGAIELVDADDLIVGTVGSTSGITTTGVDVSLTTGATLGIEAPIDLAAGNLTLTSGGAVTQTAAITAARLELLGAGPFTLTHAGNDVDTLAANTSGEIELVDADDLIVGTVGTTSGITTTGVDVSLTTGATLGIEAAIDLAGGELTLTTGGAVSQTAAITAAGLELLGAGPFTLTHAGNDVDTLAASTTGEIELVDADDLVVGTVGSTSGITTTGVDVSLTTGTTLGIEAAINLAGGNLTLTSGGAVTQTAAITAAGLELLGAGPFMLTDAGNDVDTLAADTSGEIELVDADDLIIGTVGSTSGITTTGVDVSLTTGTTLGIEAAIDLAGGNLTLTSGGVVTQTAAITAAGLELLGAGPFTLTHAGNDVDTLAASTTGEIELVDADDLVVGTVGSTSGITTTGVDVSLTTGTTLGIEAAIDLAGGELTLITGGAVSQTAAITAAGLELLGAGPFMLTDAGNDVDTLAADTTGAIELVDADDLIVGTVGSTSGITTTGVDVSLTTGTTLGIEAAINLAGGNLTLTSGGAVTQTAAITAAGLELLGVGPFTLTHAGNDVDTLAANTSGAIELVDADDLIVGTVGSTSGITTTSADVILETGTTLGIEAAINLAGGNLTLASGGAVSQTAAITAAGLELLGAGPFTLTDAGNDVDTLAADTSGEIELVDADDLVVGTVGSTSGITTTGVDVSLTTGTTLGIEAAIDLAGGELTLITGGAVSQTAAITAAGLELLGAGPFTLTDAGNDVDTLAADTSGEIELVDADDLIIGTVGSTSGITTTSVDVSLTTGTTLGIEAAINLAGGNLTLASGGAVSQTAAITAAGLELLGAGPFTLTDAGNDVDTLAADTSGEIELVDADDLVVGTVGSTSGITTTGVDVSLTTGTTLGIEAAIDLAGGELTLITGGAVSQTAAITAAGLELLGAGPFTLTDAGNDVDTLAADTSGAIELVDADDLIVGTVGTTSGITTTGVDVSLTTGTTLGIEAAIDLAGGNLTLTSGGAVTQTAAITAAGLELLGAGPFTLTDAGNDVDTLAADTTGAIELVDADDLIVGTVGSTSGITTTGVDVSLTTGTTLGIEAAINLAGGNLTLTSGGAVTQTAAITAAGLELLGAGPFTLTDAGNDVDTLAADTSGEIELVDADDLIIGTVGSTSGITTTSVDVSLTTGTTLGIGAAIDLAGGELTLTSGGAVTQTAAITAAGLELLGAGPFTLTDAGNDVDTLAADTSGEIELVDADDLIVGTVGTTSGITTTGVDVSLTTGTTLGIEAAIDLAGGNLTLTSGGAVTQTAAITAAGLELLGAGPFTLTDAGNDVDTLAADTTGQIELVDADDLIIGTVGVTSGITTTGVDVRLTTGTTLKIEAAIDLAGGSLTLTSGGAVTQTAAITATGLELLGAGPYTLTDAGNDVDTLAANTSGEIELVDADDLIVGTVGSTSGITTTGVDVSVTTGTTLGIEAAIDLAGGNLTLTSGGAVTQTAAITAAGLELLGAGPFTLAHAGNDVDTLAADTSGQIELVDADDLIVGTVGATSGITTTGVDVSLETGTTLGIGAAIDLAGGNLTLTSGGAVTQTAAITAAGLELLGAGPFTLTDAGNDVDTLAANTSGEIELVDADDLIVGTVGSTSGITTTGVDVSLTTGTTLGVEAAINLAGGNLTLTSGGAVTQTAAITAAGLEMLGAGPFTLTDAGNDVDTLAADTTGAIELVDADDLIVGTVGSTSGITTTGVDVSLTTGTTLGIEAAINLAGGELTLTSGGAVTQAAAITAVGLELLGAGPFTLTNAGNDLDTLAANTSGQIELVDADDLIVGTVGSTSGITTTGMDVSLTTGATLGIEAAINLAGGELTLTSGGAVTQTAAITAAGVEFLGAGPFTLTNAGNDVDTLAANTSGEIELVDADDLIVGTVGSTSGITTTGVDVSLTTGTTLGIEAAIDLAGGNLTLTSGGAVTQTAAITAAGLELLGAGPFTLTHAGNDVDTLAANTSGQIELVDADDLIIGTVGVTSGITTTGVDVSLITGTTLGIEAAINLAGGNLTLTSGGAVTQTAAITAAGLELLGAGPFTLTDAGNDVDTLAADTTGAIELVDADDLIVGTVGSTSGITTTGVDVSLTTGTTLGIEAAINLAGGNLTLTSGGAVTQTAAITAVGLELLGAGPFTLTHAGNDVDTLAADTSGQIELVDADDLIIGTVGSTSGITTTSVDVSLTTGATLGIEAAIDLAGGELTLTSGGAVTQTAAITAAGLELLGAGPFTLTDAGNDVDTLAANTSGEIELVDADDLIVGTVGLTSGITTTGVNVSLETGTTLGIEAAIDLAGGNLTLTSGGAVTQTAAITAAGLELLGAGSFTLTHAGNDVDTLAANTSGEIELVDADDLIIGTVGVTSGITTTGVDVSLTTGATLGIGAAIDLGAGNLTLTSGGAVTQTAAITAAGLELLGAGPFTLTDAGNDVDTLAANTSGEIELVDADDLIVGTVGSTSGITTTGVDVSLTTGTTLGIEAAINLAGGELTLTSGGAVTQAAAITAVGLELLGAGPFTLTNAGNDLDTLAANTSGQIELVDADDLIVGTVGSTSGITTTGMDVSLTTGATLGIEAAINLAGGELTLTSGGAVTQTAAITAAGVEFLGAGPFTLTNAGNDVDTLAANTSGEIELVDADDLIVGTVGSTSGITTTGVDVSLTTGTTLGIEAAIDLAGGNLTLTSGGAVTQTAAITAAGLELLGAGPFTLTHAGNDVDTLAANTSGQIELVDADDLIIGTVGVTSGITTTGVDVSLITGTTLGIEAAINLAGGNLTLTSGGAVTQTAAITAAGLELLGAGPFTLTHAGNDVDTLAANTSGEIELVDADDLIVGTVGATSGITTTGDIRLEAFDSLRISEDVVAQGNSDVFLFAGKDLTLPVNRLISGDDITLTIGAAGAGGRGTLDGVLKTNGQTVRVIGGGGDDELAIDLEIGDIQWGSLEFAGGKGDDVLTLVGTAADETVCVDEDAGWIDWQFGATSGSAVSRFFYPGVEVLDFATRDGLDQVTFHMSGNRQTALRLDGGSPTEYADPIVDGLRIFGTDGDDVITVTGTAGNGRFAVQNLETLHVFAGSGNDNVHNDDGAETGTHVRSLLVGGDGDDVLYGSTDTDVLIGGAGRDELYGNGGDDYLFADHSFTYDANGAIQIESVVPVVADEIVAGGEGSDVIVASDDIVDGGGSPLENDLYVEGGKFTVMDWLMARFPTDLDLASLIEGLESLTVLPWLTQFRDCPEVSPVLASSSASTTLTLQGTQGDDVFEFCAEPVPSVFVNGVQYTIPEGTETIVLEGLEGDDTAYLRGSEGDDEFVAWPGGAVLKAAGYSVSTTDVEVNLGYGMGGDDTATLYDSSDADMFKAKPDDDYAKMYNGSYMNRAKFFTTVVGEFSEGDDYARIWDTAGDDTLTASPTFAQLTTEDVEVWIEGSDCFLARSDSGGEDVVNLYDSEGDDVLRARPHKTVFTGAGFDITLRGWEVLHAYAENGGYDVAKLHDTEGNDVVLTGDAWASLSTLSEDDLILLYDAFGFERVKAYHSAGTDTAPDCDAVDYLLLDGEWE